MFIMVKPPGDRNLSRAKVISDGPFFSPRDREEHERGNQGYDVPDYCRNCGRAFMEHVNSRCPSS